MSILTNRVLFEENIEHKKQNTENNRLMQNINIKTYFSDFLKERNSEIKNSHKLFTLFHNLPEKKSEKEHKYPRKQRIIVACCKAIEGKADGCREIISVKGFGKFKKLYKTEAGCTVTTHCGGNTMGVLFIRKDKKTL